MTQLHVAAAGGDVAAARALLVGPSCPDINAFDVGGYTALHLAVHGGHLAMVELLLEHRALASLRAPYWEAGAHKFVSALELAALEDNYDIVKLIVSRKPKMANHTLSRSNESLLSRAYHSEAGRPHVPWLLQHGARCAKLLPSLVRAGKMDAVRELLQMGADPSCPALLCECARRGEMSTMTWLLDQGASPEVPDLLEELASLEDWDALGMLLRRGASPDHPRLLAMLVARGHTDQLEHLLSLGASPNHPLLLVAAAKRDSRLLYWLLDHGADPNCPQLLVSVAEQGRERTLRELLQRGASPNVPELLLAVARRGWTHVLFELLDLGADPSDVPGLAAVLAARGETASVFQLLERGACPDCPDLLLVVAERGDWDTLEALLQRGALAAARSPALLATVAEQGRGDVLAGLLRRGAPGDAPAMLRALAATGQRAALASLVEQGVDLASAALGLVSVAIEGAAHAMQPCEVQLLDLLLDQGGFGVEAVDWECALARPDPPAAAPIGTNPWHAYAEYPRLVSAIEEAAQLSRQLQDFAQRAGNPGPSTSSCATGTAARREGAVVELQQTARKLRSLLGQAASSLPCRPEFAAPWQRTLAAVRWMLPAMLGRAYFAAFRRPLPVLDMAAAADDARKLVPFWHQSPLWAAINCLDVGATQHLLARVGVGVSVPGLCGIDFIDAAVLQGAPARPWDCPFYQLLMRHQASWECDQGGWEAAELAAAGVAEALLGAGARPMDRIALLEVCIPGGPVVIEEGKLVDDGKRFAGYERSALLLVLRCPRWSPANHHAFPPRLRAAARTLLLLAHRGIPAGASGHRRSVSLPAEVVQLLVGHVAATLTPWLDPAPCRASQECPAPLGGWEGRLRHNGGGPPAAGQTGDEWEEGLVQLDLMEALAGQVPLPDGLY